MSEQYGKISGMDSLKSETLDRPGFETSGYIDKKGTPSGESAMFNYLPPGMDIDDQPMLKVKQMKLKKITNMGYEGDGWGSEKDVAE